MLYLEIRSFIDHFHFNLVPLRHYCITKKEALIGLHVILVDSVFGTPLHLDASAIASTFSASSDK